MKRWTMRMTCAAVAAICSVGISIGQVAAQSPSQGARLANAAQHKDMKLVGFNNLQARSAYQPTLQQQGNRWIAYVGHHGGQAVNPLTGQIEQNGTSIVDVTDPAHPVYLHHLPPSGVGESGAQMVRTCSGSELPNADATKYYMLRATGSSHEVYDITDPSHPALLTVVVANLGDTHKNFWECSTGIAYLVSDGTSFETATPSFPNWRADRVTQIFDLSNPALPVFIRNYGLVGQEPGSTGPVPTGVHGGISAISLGRDRVYFGHGTGSNGIMQIVDRTKLLGGGGCSFDPISPTPEQLLCPQVGRLDTPPTMGAHTTFPLLDQPIPEFAKNIGGKVRDFVFLVNEAGGGSGANTCTGNRQLTYFVDVETESKPMGISNFQVPEASGDFCNRGGRFGAHASSESFTPLFYGKMIFVSWFNAGVRAIDLRDPFSPKEAAYYIPATTSDTDPRCTTINGQQICNTVIQTNNVEVDDRGFIYIVDRANTGLHILELSGDARKIIQ
jgi:hypothetical protein